MAMKCNRFVTNSLIFSYRSVLRSVGERINNEEKKKYTSHYTLKFLVIFFGIMSVVFLFLGIIKLF